MLKNFKYWLNPLINVILRNVTVSNIKTQFWGKSPPKNKKGAAP